MSLKKAGKLQDVLFVRISLINTESQKTPAECRSKGQPNTKKSLKFQAWCVKYINAFIFGFLLTIYNFVIIYLNNELLLKFVRDSM